MDDAAQPISEDQIIILPPILRRPALYAEV